MQRVLSLVIILGTTIAIGCGKPPTEEPVEEDAGYSGRAQPRECATADQCASGEMCAMGYCGQPTPSSTDYRACALDADCPRGDHCSLGACSHECLSDRDCVDSTVCTNRGRCVAPEAAAQPPPVEPPLPSNLEVSTETLQFGRTTNELEVTLRNSGGTPLRFRALSDRAWLSAEPFEGEVSGQPVTLRVKVDRSAAGPDVRATLAINSTGGRRAIDAFLARDLKGIYAGEVVYTAPFPNGASTLRLKLSQAEGDTRIEGVVDAEGSLLFPAKSAVGGTISDGDVNLSFVLAGAEGSPVNPVFRRAIRRTVTLSGRASGVGLIEGVLTDSMEGPFEGDPIVLSGTFRLERIADYDGTDSPDPVPQVSLPPVANPFSNGGFAACELNCPGGTCSGDSFLAAAAPFYRWFFQESGAPAGNPFADLSSAGFACDGTTCLNYGYLRCAQYYYAQRLLTHPEDLQASTGFLDALEILADYALLFGNQKLVDAAMAWKTPGSLDNEVRVIEAANRTLLLGNHIDQGGQPYAMFDPGVLAMLVSGVAPLSIASGDSNIPTLLNDFDQRAGREHLRRQTMALGGLVRGHLELATRQWRLGRGAEARATAVRGSMIAFIDLAVVGRLVGRSGAVAAMDESAAVLHDVEQLVRLHGDISSARNPAGYLDSHVPFLLDVAHLPENNFEQIHSFATSIYQSLAKPDLEAARATSREFETSAEGLQTQLEGQESEYEERLQEACGTVELMQCGQPGSTLAAAGHEAEIASLRVQQAGGRIEDLSAEIAIEVERARQISGIHDNEAKLIFEDGHTLMVLAEKERVLDEVADTLRIASDFSSAASHATKWWEVLAEGLSASTRQVAMEISNRGKGEIEQQRIELETRQRARVEFNQARAELINSEAVIKTKLLEQHSLQIDLLIAQEAWAQAVENLLGLEKKVRLYQAERERFARLKGQQVRRMLHQRVFSDYLGLRAQRSFAMLLDWTYLATRAMEYELNSSYSPRSGLWEKRTADELNTYLLEMMDFYRRNKPFAPQRNLDVISLRDDVLELGTEVADGVTGRSVEPRERFRRFVADPANRDVDGNLKIRFTTNRPDKSFFSKAVCVDRISSIRVNLVGDNLGVGVESAYVKLMHGGANHLRSCGGDHGLVAYDLTEQGRASDQAGMASRQAGRTARIQAGVNAPNRESAGLPNTDLMLRAVLAGEWELVIEKRADVEPANANLDIAGLDDIELIVEHEAATIQ